MSLSDATAYYRFDTSPGLLVDSTGNGNALTNVGGVTSTTGKIGTGQAASFASASSQMLTAPGSSFSPGSGFTIGGWINTSSANTTQLIAGKSSNTGNNTGFLVYIAGDATGITFAASPDGTAGATVFAQSSVNPTVSTWYFFAAWWSAAAGLNISINNGTAVNHALAAVFNPSTLFRIGCDDRGSLYFNGAMDGIGFWSRVLTSGEITTWYNGGSGLDPTFPSGGLALLLSDMEEGIERYQQDPGSRLWLPRGARGMRRLGRC